MDAAASQNTNTNLTDEQVRDALSKMSTDEILQTVALSLLIEKGFTDLDEDTKKDMINDLVEREYSFIERSVIAALPEDKRAEVNKMIENDAVSDDAVQKVIAESGIDTETITSEALTKFREIYLGLDKETEE